MKLKTIDNVIYKLENHPIYKAIWAPASNLDILNYIGSNTPVCRINTDFHFYIGGRKAILCSPLIACFEFIWDLDFTSTTGFSRSKVLNWREFVEVYSKTLDLKIVMVTVQYEQ